MPTPKETAFHLERIERRIESLQRALNEAHNAAVIVYDQTKFQEESPCYLLYKTKERIEKTTEKAILKAYRLEIRKKVHGY